MKLVVGLGNPGRKYDQTRHNIGFLVAAGVAKKLQADAPRRRFEGEVAEARCGEQKVAILAPETYMNASGRSVRQAVDFYKLDPGDVLVVSDDLHLSLGRLRIRSSGSAGGQKGLADILRVLGTEQVPRLRVGIGQVPEGWDAADYVLSRFRSDERETVDAAIDRATEAVVAWIESGIEVCMNQYNRA